MRRPEEFRSLGESDLPPLMQQVRPHRILEQNVTIDGVAGFLFSSSAGGGNVVVTGGEVNKVHIARLEHNKAHDRREGSLRPTHQAEVEDNIKYTDGQLPSEIRGH